jgi:hypothetical protein
MISGLRKLGTVFDEREGAALAAALFQTAPRAILNEQKKPDEMMAGPDPDANPDI